MKEPTFIIYTVAFQ